ncbi:MAG TPA: type I methionyl aminopeptidase [Verrucomicrobiota bacterium]|jgi:methionyl aminopeptidase|nr:type I methionyl aminopeptidase [Verrucomicrobiota bacterium]HRR64993.1 type I methionyl aminopeptidase [Candidatus Paceibacterota bacterium]NLH85947.1 type I methionyl aminopeptidase [Verrucomicrobiota bacterium]HNR72255.1 type I methionyl aminopeptidase [Verrucomicrobiota bacterium]HNS69562.1 type I methionyl aminopeptidase [Verrucomicrobiota bacterium]
MIILKSERDLEAMRPACVVAATVLNDVAAFIQPGVSTKQVDEFAASRIKQLGARSAFLGYRKYPCHTCISVNDQVVHGLAGTRVLQFGDIVSLDVGVIHNGFIGDTARTLAVGGCGVLAQRLMDVTEKGLYLGIAQARAGGKVSDISRAIQDYVEGNGFNVVREFVGHGVGRSMHEDPQIPNFTDGKPSPKLRAGMTLAIEPMVNAGGPEVKMLNDGWTAVTKDGSLSAHFEHTVLVTESEPEILTCLEKVSLK